jgi:hypothetical protein
VSFSTLRLQDSLGGIALGDDDEDESEMDEAADVQFNVTVTKVTDGLRFMVFCVL